MMYGLALCAGVGMLDEGVRAGFEFLGIDYRTVCYVERDAYAASVIVARMEDETVDRAPVWDDLVSFDGSAWRGIVDCITAGFPCQPHSMAGKRKGIGDERWIWPDIAGIIRDVQPRFVFLENVRGLFSSGGFEAVIGSLAELRFDAEWALLPASAVGAGHQRERAFILAYRAGPRWAAPRGGLAQHPVGKSESRGGIVADTQSIGSGSSRKNDGFQRSETIGNAEQQPDSAMAITANLGCERGTSPGRETLAGLEHRCSGMADSNGQGLGCVRERRCGDDVTDGCNQKLADPHIQRPQGGGRCAQQEKRDDAWKPGQDRAIFAPGPAHHAWDEILTNSAHLAPAIKPGVCELVDGVAVVVDESRADQLRCTGNGVVPLQAATALVELVLRAGLI